jgi:hypothetical protein
MPTGRVVYEVLVATQNEGVYQALRARDDVRFDIALYTGTIKEMLPKVQLAIIDYENIVEYPFTQADIHEVVVAQELDVWSSEEFLADPDARLKAINKAGRMRLLPEKYCIAFASYSGGTGRTTLALDTALSYAAVMKEYEEKHKNEIQISANTVELDPAMVVELTHGTSSLISLTGLEMPSLYQLATQPEAQALKYKGVTLVPMDYENARMLSVDLLKGYLQQQMSQHRLTVVDCIWPHGLAKALVENVDLWVVLAANRPDAVVNAQKLYDELKAEFSESQVWLASNQIVNVTRNKRGAKNSPSDMTWNITLPHVSRPDDYQGELGRVVLSKVFHPVWQEYDKSQKVSTPAKKKRA